MRLAESSGYWRRLVAVALETPPLIAIVAQNASVPSYGWGSFSSSRSCFHQHRGGWIAISESIISAIDSDCLGCTCLKWGRDRELMALDLGLDLRSAEVSFWAGLKHYLCRRYELLSPAPCPCIVILAGGLGSELSSIALQWCA
jgi:hypothetical protein